MFSSARTASLVMLACLAALVFAGCGNDLDKDKVFQDHRAHVDKIDDDLKSAMRTIGRLDTEIQQLSRELATIKDGLGAPGAGGSSDAVRALEQRLNGIENQLKRAVSTPAAAPAAQSAAPRTASAKAPQNGQLVTVVAKPSDAVPEAAPRVPTARPAASKTPVIKTSSVRKTAPKATVRKATPPAAIPAVIRHSVTQTDTLASIAEKYKITPDALLAANRLPTASRLFIGQSLIIPRKANQD